MHNTNFQKMWGKVPAQVPERGAGVPKTSLQFQPAMKDITARLNIKKEQPRKDGTALLYVDCYMNGKRVRIGSGLFVRPEHFNLKGQQVRASHPQARDYNLFLQEMLQRVHELRVKARLGKLNLDREAVRNFVKNARINACYIQYMAFKVEQRKNELADDTYRMHRSVCKKLREWRGSIGFEEINNNLVYSYRDRERKRGLKESSIDKQIQVMRVYMALAQEDGFELELPLRALKRKRHKGQRHSLTRQQLQRLQQLYDRRQFKPETHSVLRYFLFSCYTGLRYKDVKQLTGENLHKGRLMFVPNKTKNSKGQILSFQLNQRAQALLLDDPKAPLGSIVSNQKTNKQLKFIGQAIGFKDLTYHISRHTCATVFLELGGDVEVLKDILGHSTLNQTMEYVHIVRDRKDAQLGNFDLL